MVDVLVVGGELLPRKVVRLQHAQGRRAREGAQRDVLLPLHAARRLKLGQPFAHDPQQILRQQMLAHRDRRLVHLRPLPPDQLAQPCIARRGDGGGDVQIVRTRLRVGEPAVPALE